MSVAKISEITSTSKKSFEDAIEAGVRRASKTLRGLQSAWVADQQVYVKGGKISTYEVRLKVTFLMED
jgi:dodecin